MSHDPKDRLIAWAYRHFKQWSDDQDDDGTFLPLDILEFLETAELLVPGIPKLAAEVEEKATDILQHVIDQENERTRHMSQPAPLRAITEQLVNAVRAEWARHAEKSDANRLIAGVARKMCRDKHGDVDVIVLHCPNEAANTGSVHLETARLMPLWATFWGEASNAADHVFSVQRDLLRDQDPPGTLSHAFPDDTQ